MLFDLRSRGRRRTVQAVYVGLAILMGGGLVLFGVGAGNGFGGILNAFTGNGGSGAQTAIVNQQEQAALKQIKTEPNNPAAWASLVQARYTVAGEGSNYNSATNSYTTSGKQELARLALAWQHYLRLTKSPDPNLAILAARAYGQLGQYAEEANAWDVQTLASPNEAKGYECLAAASYAAKQTRKGDLAAAKALSLIPKSSQLTLKQALQAAKTDPAVAANC